MQTDKVTPNSRPIREPPAVIALLSTLVSSYPSQSTYHGLLRSFPVHIVPATSIGRRWLKSLAFALRSSNFYQLHRLATPAHWPPFLHLNRDRPAARFPRSQLASLAGAALLSRLQEKAQLHTWAILRVVYPQFACQTGSPTRSWLARSLRLSPRVIGDDDGEVELDVWLSSRAGEGEIKLKEGVEGRWVVVKKS
jgi:hypothetical protein